MAAAWIVEAVEGFLSECREACCICVGNVGTLQKTSPFVKFCGLAQKRMQNIKGYGGT